MTQARTESGEGPPGNRPGAVLYYFDTGPGPFAFNMALDQALLEAMPRLNVGVLRFYGWTEPAASFGYFQKYSEVERLTPLRPLVRRPTAGGIVPHAADWTYSMVWPENHAWYRLRAVESYRRVHEWIRDAFARLDLQTELALESLKTGPGQCFAGFERFDLLYHGRKIAGAAQRRTREGLLIQGSVQPPPGSLSRTAWQRAMLDAADPSATCKAWEVDEALARRALALAEEKYSQPSYNRRR